MKIMIIRHGDPDYVHDSLTVKGENEAKYLADMMENISVTAFYCSPLGRAQKTAAYTLERLNRTAETLEWLREFEGNVPNEDNEWRIPWDRMPSKWTADDRLYSNENWMDSDMMTGGTVRSEYKFVCDGFDKLLEKHGYRRNGRIYDAVHPNTDTIALFCHFGVESVLLSRLFNIPPTIIWQNFVALPTSVTTLKTEEREKGKAIFRCSSFGDLSHLYAAGEKPSPAASFCEIYD